MDITKFKPIARPLAIISTGIITLVSILMILNLLQISIYHPIESDTIDQLVTKLDGSEDDIVLREQIRVVDLMARKAYFSYLWQIETGAWIVLIFSILLVVSLQVLNAGKPLESVDIVKKEHFWVVRSRERKWILISVGALAFTGLVISLGSGQYYSDFRSMTLTEVEAPEPQGQAASPSIIQVREESGFIAVSSSDEEPMAANESITESEVAIPEVTASPATAATFPSEAQVRSQHPGFRGPFGLGISSSKNTPVDWNGASSKNVIWKKEITLPGLNSPVVWGDRVFLSGANATTRKVFCFNRTDGRLLWEKEIKNIPGSPANSPRVTNDTGHAASGVTTDGQRVYAIYSNGDLVAIDMQGNLVWGKNLGVPDNHYGHSSSLQFFQDKLIVQYDDNKSCRLFAFSTHTGEQLWQTRREGEISWSSPLIVPKGNTAEIIVNNLPWVGSYDVNTGRENWRLQALSGEIGPSPAYGNGMVFVANEYASMMAIKDGKKVWEGWDYLPDVSSPVAFRDWLFVTTSYGDMACINQKDGSLVWHHEFDIGFYGSPVIADGKLYCIDRTGGTAIVEASGTFKLIGHPALGEKSDNTPAFVDGMVFIRGEKHLFAIGKK
jgi:outer membrane protein assembly factor BamB